MIACPISSLGWSNNVRQIPPQYLTYLERKSFHVQFYKVFQSYFDLQREPSKKASFNIYQWEEAFLYQPTKEGRPTLELRL